MLCKTTCIAIAVALLFADCGAGKGSEVKSAAVAENGNSHASFQYNLAKPSATWSLPSELLEISGNAWIDDSHLLVIEDTHPLLYVVRLAKEGVVEKAIPFAQDENKKFDIEDVALHGNTAYALWSHGTIYKIDNWQANPTVTTWETELDKKNNTEGLCFDPQTNDLLIACKNNSGDPDEKKSTRAIYRFRIASGKLDSEPFLLIEQKDFSQVSEEKFDFYPSAIAVHPVNGDIYVLSTKNTKGLAQYSHDGKFIGFQEIDKDLMPQPEGLCFSPNGVMYISTEGKHGEPGKILKFESGNPK